MRSKIERTGLQKRQTVRACSIGRFWNLRNIEREAPDGWTWARSIDEAIKFASYEYVLFEECSLDHDLGHGDDEDGILFVDWMVVEGIWPKKKPQVHSMNPVGRKRMEMTINRYFPGESE